MNLSVYRSVNQSIECITVPYDDVLDFITIIVNGVKIDLPLQAHRHACMCVSLVRGCIIICFWFIPSLKVYMYTQGKVESTSWHLRRTNVYSPKLIRISNGTLFEYSNIRTAGRTIYLNRHIYFNLLNFSNIRTDLSTSPREERCSELTTGERMPPCLHTHQQHTPHT